MLRRPLLCLLLVLSLSSLPATGQSAFLVRDINATTYETPWPYAGQFRDLHAAGGKLFFLGGEEVWVSDGTATGTEALLDICPWPCEDSTVFLGSLGNLMLWVNSRTGLHGTAEQLWRSDGTRPGTFALTEAGVDVNTPIVGAFFRDAFYFRACSGSGEGRDCDLWRTDGSVAGTRVFHGAPGYLSWVHVAGDRLFYLAPNAQGSELWATDGTPAGTVLLRQFEGGFNAPRAQASAGGRLFFHAQVDGWEVWTSDGTAAGTRALTSFPAYDPFESADWLEPAGNRVYFVADDGLHGREIWRSDGTSAGTVRVTELGDEDPISDHDPAFLEEVGGRLVFQAYVEGITSNLWVTRGTPESTAPLPLPCGDCGLYSRLVLSGGKVFFLTQEGLWATDGTASGTRLLCAACGSRSLMPWRGGILFVPDDLSDQEIWFSDGTAKGTKPLTALDVDLVFPLAVAEVGGKLYFLAESDSLGEPGSLWVTTGPQDTRPVFTMPVPGPTSHPGRLVPYDGRLFFTAWDSRGFDLWWSSGTPESTGPVGTAGGPIFWYEASELVPASNLLFFLAEQAHEGHDLWRTDGTLQGTFAVAHLPRETALVPFQGSLYFFNGQEIWKTDGTLQGTVKTGDLPQDLFSPVHAVPGLNGIYIAAYDALGFTDGTTTGTRRLLSLSSGAGADLELERVGSLLYFSWDGHLWRTDGTLAETVPLDLPSGTRLTEHQGALYYFSSSFSQGGLILSLWRTDGTAAGTVRLRDFPNQSTESVELQSFAGKLFFNVEDGIHGVELWATDGTPAGTAMVADLLPGRLSSGPRELTVGGGRLFFSAADDVHGVELWQSDGTAAGTRMVQDIAPQVPSSRPDQLTVVGDKLYFTAHDGLAGRELWVVPLAAAPGCKPSPIRLCLNGGRYAVEAAWRDFQGTRGVGHAVPLTSDTGYFWFFDEENVEVVLKALDGRGVNGHVWVFYGALSTVEYSLTVTDTETGVTRRYVNPSGHLASVGDTESFGPLGAASRIGDAPSPAPRVERSTVAAAGVCEPGPTRLCLNGDRFAVEATWKDFQGNEGVGKVVELTPDTGYFWFFDEANVEVVLKVLNGLPVNGHHWVFYGALSSVEYTITVTDSVTGTKVTYRNPSGNMASVADTGAFPF